jgi:predicted RNA-binding protein with EMAP domain
VTVIFREKESIEKLPSDNMVYSLLRPHKVICTEDLKNLIRDMDKIVEYLAERQRQGVEDEE